ncbi:antibiotic biosynthesis monooxygenase [Pseudomonas sp.]|uniref:antibiotic biosynthesis monooxygenase n=1 Tax=Pseudomonas sp. TaxID=306 RepID=UPI003D6F2DD8
MSSSKSVITVKILMSSAIDVAKKREVISLVARLRTLPGCLSFSLTQSKSDNQLWVLNSHWVNDASMRSYFFEQDLSDLVQIFVGRCKEMRFNTHFGDEENARVV